MTFSDQHDCIAPIDARYWDEETASYLSDRAFLRYKLMIEAALASQLAARGLCDPQIATEIVTACTNLGFFPGEVDTEEQRVHHDVRAMVNCLQHRVSEQARPFVHLCATSYDIVDTANALRFRDATQLLLVPHLSALAAVLTRQAEQYRNTVQVGRTHGQHAVPITFGFALAGYSSRLTGCLEHLSALAKELPGKFSGAVGAYNALSLIVADPLEFERELLSGLGLSALSPTTQIVQPEPRIRLLLEVCLAAGIMADLSDDMRHLQRSEIAEVGEEFATGAVGSSTMPQKRNPISFENAKAMWKVLITRFQLVLMDQLSEHQRDLTNSMTSRTYGEIIAYTVAMAKRLTRAMEHLRVDESSLARNLAMSKGHILAEPLYILLAIHGHPDAHEAIRRITLKATARNQSFLEAVLADPDIKSYIDRLTEEQRSILSDPDQYIGQSAVLAVLKTSS